MSSTFGKHFRVTTFGESHGKALGVIIDGVRPNRKFDTKIIEQDLARRAPGQSPFTTQRKEGDKIEVLSGVFEGKTLGTPICIIIRNEDIDSSSYEELKDVFRPGHADFTYFKKYGIYDHRGGGRASGRETVARVIAGAVAKSILSEHNIMIVGFTSEVYGIKAKNISYAEIKKSPIRFPDEAKAKEVENIILDAKKNGDSVGGIVEINVFGVPAGLGDPVFDKLDADLAKALMSIGGVKGIEFGSGFGLTKIKGSESNDGFFDGRTLTNYCGGILGGISSGSPIIIRLAVKPTPSIAKKQNTINKNGDNVQIEIKGRHDPCLCPRIVPVAEAMVAITLLDAML